MRPKIVHCYTHVTVLIIVILLGLKWLVAGSFNLQNFWIFSVFTLPYLAFRESLSNSMQNPTGILIGITLKSVRTIV